MADKQDTFLVLLQCPFQFVLGIHVQVVGGLVQEEEVGVAVDELAEADLGLLATA